jgi:hypothetical protein
MSEEIDKVVDEYLDKFIASDLVLIKIKDEIYPINTLKRIFLERIKERELQQITSYIFLQELYLEKI